MASTVVALALVAMLAACGDEEPAASSPSSRTSSGLPASSTAPSQPASPSSTSATVTIRTTPPSDVATPPTPATAAPSAPSVDVREGSNPCSGDELPALAAFDAASGELAWTVCSGDEAYRTVLGATDLAAYVAESVGGASALVAHDVADGQEQWRRPVDPMAGAGQGWPKGPVAGSGTIVVADGPQDAPQLVGLDATTGAPRWQVEQAAIAVAPGASAPATTVRGMPPPRWAPVAGTDQVVVVRSDRDELVGLDRVTGEQRWALPSLGGRDESGDMAGLAAAAVLGDLVVLPAGSETVAIDAASGSEVWRAPRLDDPWADEAYVAGARPPAGSSGPPPSEIAALDAATGAAASVVPGNESYGDRLAVGDGGVFVLDPEDSRDIVGYDLATGAERWTSSAGAHVGQPQGVLGDLVLTLWEGSLGALATADGTVRWAWHHPVGSDWMDSLGTNATTVFVAVNSLPFGD